MRTLATVLCAALAAGCAGGNGITIPTPLGTIESIPPQPEPRPTGQDRAIVIGDSAWVGDITIYEHPPCGTAENGNLIFPPPGELCAYMGWEVSTPEAEPTESPPRDPEISPQRAADVPTETQQGAAGGRPAEPFGPPEPLAPMGPADTISPEEMAEIDLARARIEPPIEEPVPEDPTLAEIIDYAEVWAADAWAGMSSVRRAVVIDLMQLLGPRAVAEMTGLRNALHARDWNAAAMEIYGSGVADAVGGDAMRALMQHMVDG